MITKEQDLEVRQALQTIAQETQEGANTCVRVAGAIQLMYDTLLAEPHYLGEWYLDQANPLIVNYGDTVTYNKVTYLSIRPVAFGSVKVPDEDIVNFKPVTGFADLTNYFNKQEIFELINAIGTVDKGLSLYIIRNYDPAITSYPVPTGMTIASLRFILTIGQGKAWGYFVEFDGFTIANNNISGFGTLVEGVEDIVVFYNVNEDGGENPGGGTTLTAEQIRDLLETLIGEERLDASAIKNLPTSGGNNTINNIPDFDPDAFYQYGVEPELVKHPVDGKLRVWTLKNTDNTQASETRLAPSYAVNSQWEDVGYDIPADAETPINLPFSQVIDFNPAGFHSAYTQTAPVNFTLNATNAKVGDVAHYLFNSDGVNALTFADNFDFVYGVVKGQPLKAGLHEIFFLYRGNGLVSVNIPSTDNTVTTPEGPVTLATPAGFSALGTNNTTITLSWQDTANESGYQLDSSTDNTTFTSLATLAAGVTTYAHTGLTAGALRYYRLKATGNGSTYLDSGYATATGNTTNIEVDNLPVQENRIFSFKSYKGITKDANNKVSNADTEFGYNIGQANATQQPTYVENVYNGKPAIRFSGGGLENLQGGTNFNILGESRTFFVVGKATANGTWFSKTTTDAYGNKYFLRYSGGVLVFGVGEDYPNTAQISSNRPFGALEVITVRINRATKLVEMWANHTLLGSASLKNDASYQITNPFKFFLGGFGDANGNPYQPLGFVGDICRQDFYNVALTDQQVTDTVNALATEWGVVV